MFGQKLDTLMKITNTNNNTLAKFLMFDPSYISRVRNGQRKLPRGKQMIADISRYFATNITDENQKKLLMTIISPGNEFPSNPELTQQLLYNWFVNNETDDNSITNMMLRFSSKEYHPPIDYAEYRPDSLISDGYFYGNSGKREAVISFLEYASKRNKAYNLYLYSDESLNWLYENTSYTKK